MTLPPEFHWVKSSQSRPGDPDVVACGGQWVAQLFQRVDNHRWMARLDIHLEPRASSHARVRPCTDEATGRAGVEQWVARHRERLVREVDDLRAARDANKIKPA